MVSARPATVIGPVSALITVLLLIGCCGCHTTSETGVLVYVFCACAVWRFSWNHKRVCRIYRELELNMRIKPKIRLKRDKPMALAVPPTINETWSMDFMRDQLEDGRSFRLLNILDDCNREGLVLK